MQDEQKFAAVIESIIRRPGGTKATASDNTEYHFKPDHTGRHVAAFTDQNHAAEFLRVSEAFRFVGSIPMESLEGETGVKPNGIGLSREDTAIAAGAPQPEPATVSPEPAADTIDGGSVDGQGDGVPIDDSTVRPALGEEVVLSPDMDIDHLRKVFVDVIGRNPSPRAKAETLIAQIEAFQSEAVDIGGAGA